MSEQLPLEMASRTDKGMVRSHNEDSILTDPEHGLAVLADGMGGYNAGEVASGLAVSLVSQGIVQNLPTAKQLGRLDVNTGMTYAAKLVWEQIALANRGVYEMGQTRPECNGMGTTLVTALFYSNRLCVGHVGDSRLYRYRAGQLEQLTKDHSLVQEQLDSGIITADEARHSATKNLVTRALGIEPAVEPEINEYRAEEGDIYLLCSDGMCDMVEESDIAKLLADNIEDLDTAAVKMVEAANENGGRDNISVILVKLRGDPAVAKGLWQRIFKGGSGAD